MSVPVVPSKSATRVPSDPDAELLWPPPDEAQFAIEVMDLQSRRVLSLDELAAEMPPGAEEQQSRSTTQFRDAGPLRDVGPRTASVINARIPEAAPADLNPPDTVTARFGEITQPPRAIRPLPRISTAVLLKTLIAIVLLQALAIALFLVRGRSAREAVPLLVSTRVPAAKPAPAAPGPEERPALMVSSPPAAPAAREGRLLVRSDPPGAVVAIDGRHRGTAPLTVDDLAAGSHRVQLGTSGTSIEQTVTIEAGATTSLVVPMQNTGASSGWVNVGAPINVQVFENGRLLGSSADGPLRLTVGSHKLQLANESLGYRGSETIVVRAGEVARLRPVLPVGLLHVNAQPWANVSLDGEPIGETPLANIKVALGRHEIRFTHPSFGEQVRQVIVSATEPVRISVSMKP
jgi:PEGA domain-containing protein